MSELDPQQQELLEQLDSGKRSLRVAAIVQLSKTSVDRQILLRLRELASDRDREVAMFASQAVIRIQARLGENGREEASEGTAEKAGGSGEAVVHLTRDALLVPIPAEVPVILEFIRLHPFRVEEDLRPAAAEFLTRHGAATDVSVLNGWLKECRDNSAFAFLEAIEHLSPSSLVGCLPRLLASDQPLVRARAIVALQKIDPEEAYAHLSEICASRNAEERLAGVRQAFFFPFGQVREMLFTILGQEKDADVVASIETLLASNPEIESAMRLLDLIDTAPKDMGKTLSRIYKTIAESLAACGLLTPQEADPKALLARWQKERLQRFLADLEIKLAVADQARRESIQAWLAANMKLPQVAALVQRLALNPATEGVVRSLISPRRKKDEPPTAPTSQDSAPRPLESGSTSKTSSDAVPADDAAPSIGGHASPESPSGVATPAPTPSAPSAPAAAPSQQDTPPAATKKQRPAPHPRDLSVEEKRAWLWQVREEQAGQWGSWIRGEARNAETPVRLAAMMALSRFPAADEDVAIAEAALAEKDPVVRAAGFRLLEKRDRNRLTQRLPELLASEAPALRALAVRFAFTVDQERALATLARMLQSPDTAQRAQAMAALFFAPFDRVKDLLVTALEKETHPDIARQILLVIMSNPSQDLLDALDDLQRPANPAVGMIIAQARIDLFDLLMQLNLLETRAAGASRKKAPKAPQTAEPPAGEKASGEGKPDKPALEAPAKKSYGVAEVREEIRRRESAWKSPSLPDAPRGGSPNIKLFAGLTLIIVLLAGAPLLFLGNSPASDEPAPVSRPVVPSTGSGREPAGTPPGDGAPPEGFVMNRACRLDGKLEKIRDDGLWEVSAAGKKLLVRMVASHPTIIGGEMLDMTVLPYRKLKSGEIVAKEVKIGVK